MSPSFHDHIKVFIPAEGTAFDTLPEMGPKGPIFDPAEMLEMRDYTPHQVDPLASMLQIDVSLHACGPATAWAMRVKAGERVMIGGPCGSFVVGTGYDWHLLVGDETALPAIRRRLLEIPKDTRAVVFAEVEGPEDEEALVGPSDLTVHWVHRTNRGERRAANLFSSIEAERLPVGDHYAWVACESSDAKSIRALLPSKGSDPVALKAAGYWRRGTAAVHDLHDQDT